VASVIAALTWVAVLASFFSSRRRHTISKRDWSSDVCSSDLERINNRHLTEELVVSGKFAAVGLTFANPEPEDFDRAKQLMEQLRSEERRVGKECRSRWSWSS